MKHKEPIQIDKDIEDEISKMDISKNKESLEKHTDINNDSKIYRVNTDVVFTYDHKKEIEKIKEGEKTNGTGSTDRIRRSERYRGNTVQREVKRKWYDTIY